MIFGVFFHGDDRNVVFVIVVAAVIIVVVVSVFARGAEARDTLDSISNSIGGGYLEDRENPPKLFPAKDRRTESLESCVFDAKFFPPGDKDEGRRQSAGSRKFHAG